MRRFAIDRHHMAGIGLLVLGLIAIAIGLSEAASSRYVSIAGGLLSSAPPGEGTAARTRWTVTLDQHIGQLEADNSLLHHNRALLSGAKLSLQHRPTDWQLVTQFGSDALARAPMNAEAWLVLALARSALAGEFDEVAGRALLRSYLVVPFGPLDLQRWRASFAIQVWPELDPATRRHLAANLSVIAR
ncbi:MAG: hypothetical protein AAGB03_04325, partial [Pseudomonadota bacterium]